MAEVIERVFKLLVFLPFFGLVAWWMFSAWLDRELSTVEAVIGFFLLGNAFLLGALMFIYGGWGFINVLAVVYVVLLALAVWQYTYIKKRDEQYLENQIKNCLQAIERDPTNAAAYSFLGQAYLKLNDKPAAIEAFEQALKLDPNSRQDRRLLKLAKVRAGLKLTDHSPRETPPPNK